MRVAPFSYFAVLNMVAATTLLESTHEMIRTGEEPQPTRRKSTARSHAVEIIWSSVPGCYERHLQRKFQNPLFPVKARVVTQEDVDAARELDAAEVSAFRAEIRNLKVTIRELASRRSVSFREWGNLREVVDALLDRADELGGDLEKEREYLWRLYGGMIEDALQATGGHKDLQHHFIPAIIYSTLQKPTRGDPSIFAAQLTRKGTPISLEEVVPSLLSEDLKEIQAFVKRLCEEPYLPERLEKDQELAARRTSLAAQGRRAVQEFRVIAERLVRDARAAGIEIPGIDAKLAALDPSRAL